MFNPVEAVEQFIKHPSVSTDSSFKEGMSGARDHIAGLLKGIGLKVEIAETPLHPVVLARREGPKEWPHVMIYGHYDVQPADPIELWKTPPFEPTIKDGRLYGRGSADNKGPMMVNIAGFAKLLEKYPDLPMRVTFLIEGEEEIGSPSFNGFIEKYKDLLDVDFILLSDTSSKSEDEIMITTGLRGVACMDVKLIGPNSDLHSGMYGGAVVNPIMALAKLCATLHDEDGKVNIPGFYDDVQFPEAWEREELERMDDGEESLKEFLGVPALFKHKGYTAGECIRFLPTLEYNGIGGGYQGEGSKTIVPSEAFVKISCRVVPDQDPYAILELVSKILRERCPEGVTMEIEIGHSGGAYCVTPPDRSNTPADQNPVLADAFRAMDAAIKDVYGNPACYSREGGSVPIIGDLKRILGADSLMLGMFTPKSKLHAPNESLDIEMFEKGIEVSYRTLASVAKVEA
jgi:acetylornithine deacetylase/succinyl-diaminopimelate desuccinylase-like protein